MPTTPDERWVPPGHPLAGHPDFGAYWAPFLAEVDATEAPRLPGKRRDFRAVTDGPRLLDLMTEFDVLLWLHRCGLRPEFGATDGTPMPDFVLPDLGLGIEVTRLGRPNVGWKLVRLVMDETRGRRPRRLATIRMSAHPVMVRQRVMDEIRVEVRASLEQDEPPPVFAVLRPAHDDSPAVTVAISFDRPFGSVIPTLVAPPPGRTPVARHDVENLIAGVLTEKRKRRQGEAMPTVLCVEVGGLMPAITRTDAEAWSRRLAEILAKHRERTSFAALALIAFGATSPVPRVALGVTPPSAVVSRWADAIGIGPHGGG